MTQKETELLKIERSKLITGIDISIVLNSDLNDYYINIGKAKYYNFGETLALLNDLENHAK
tara:strand:+ start:245 stop:427 length:183 start_codon:yes stop_codon:yes gene_type:complete